MAKQAFFKKLTIAVGTGVTMMIGQSLILTSMTYNGANIPEMLGDNNENSQGLMGDTVLNDPFLQQELDQ